MSEAASAAPSAVPLLAIEPGRTVRLVAIEGGHHLRMRLAAHGLRPGTPLTVVQNRPNGPVIVACSGARIVLGRGMVQCIRVV